MSALINLPAKGRRNLLVGCADIQGCQAQHQQTQQRCIEITVDLQQQLEISDLVPNFRQSPVRPHIYALRIGWEVLRNMCNRNENNRLNCDICAFIAEDQSGISTRGWGRPLIIYLVPRGTHVRGRDDLCVLATYTYSQPVQGLARPYIVYWPCESDIQPLREARASFMITLELVIRGSAAIRINPVIFAQSTAVTTRAKYVSVYPAWLTLEADVSKQQVAGGSVSLLNSLLNIIYLGSTVVVRDESRGRYVQPPGVIMYDLRGTNLPQITTSAEGVEIAVGVNFDEVVRQVFSGGSLDALAKVLVSNIVAQTVAALCGIRRRWIFERVIDARVAEYGDVWFTSPMLYNVLRVYRELMLGRYSTPQGVWASYIHTLINQILRAGQNCIGSINSVFSDLVNAVNGQARQTPQASVLKDAVALAALMYGAHGVAHIVARALGTASKGALSEIVEIRLRADRIKSWLKEIENLNREVGGLFGETLLMRIFESLDRGREGIYNGLFLLRRADSGGTNFDAEVLIRVYGLRGLPVLPSGGSLDAYLMERVRDVLYRDGKDRCNEWYWTEERNRLERAWSALRGGAPPGSDIIDAFMSNLASGPQPPRDVFRFLLRDILREIYRSRQYNQILSQHYQGAGYFIREFLRGGGREYLQYIWPRHVKYCSDGCHLCVRLTRRACVMPPVQEALYTSKTLALYLLRKAGLLS